jgi:phosphoribosylanthranilate isomerase
VIVKICGITRLEDALAALEAGADILGYNFYPGSARFIDENSCREIQKALHARGLEPIAIGVFVNHDPAEIERLLDKCSLTLAQLSGDEPSDTIQQLGKKAVKAIRPRDYHEALDGLDQIVSRREPPHFLLDTFRSGQFGGTGQQGDWEIARTLAQDYSFLLAGGLTPENVADAIRHTSPWGVDVASGVENTPGVKDREKMRRFISRAKHAFAEISSARVSWGNFNESL